MFLDDHQVDSLKSLISKLNEEECSTLLGQINEVLGGVK
jgi:hypothetical protein